MHPQQTVLLALVILAATISFITFKALLIVQHKEQKRPVLQSAMYAAPLLQGSGTQPVVQLPHAFLPGV